MPSALVSVLDVGCGSQLVGFNVNPVLSMLTLTSRTWVTIPSMIVGIGSLPVRSMLTCAGYGLTFRPKWITTVPRWNGPITAELTDTTESGTPRKGPDRY